MLSFFITDLTQKQHLPLAQKQHLPLALRLRLEASSLEFQFGLGMERVGWVNLL